MSVQNINENELFNIIISKIDKIKDNIIKIKNYTEINDNNKNIEYIEKLYNFSTYLNELYATSKDLRDLYLLQTNQSILSYHDQEKQKKLLLEKKVNKIIMPLVLYLQIIMQNVN